MFNKTDVNNNVLENLLIQLQEEYVVMNAFSMNKINRNIVLLAVLLHNTCYNKEVEVNVLQHVQNHSIINKTYVLVNVQETMHMD